MHDINELLSGLSINDTSGSEAAVISQCEEGCQRCITLLQDDPFDQSGWRAGTPEKALEMAAIIELWTAAASAGNERAQLILGCVYQYGIGVEVDAGEAARLYALAAAQGNDTAQLKLGNLYYTGQGVARNIDSAMDLYKQSADQNNPEAQYQLGSILASGVEGVLQDREASHEWLSKAAANEHEQAREELGSCRLRRRRTDDDSPEEDGGRCIRRPRQAFGFNYGESSAAAEEHENRVSPSTP